MLADRVRIGRNKEKDDEEFFLDFEPLFIEQVGGVWMLTTQTVTIPQDCGLWMNIEATVLPPSGVSMDWYRNGDYIRHSSANNWGNPYVEFLQGDSLYIQGLNNSSSSDFIGTVKLHLNSPDGVVVAQFDFNLPMRSSGDCFLTTTMVNYYSKADNCPELMAMRTLRSHSGHKYPDVLDEYHRVSPLIIQGIERTGQQNYYYSMIKDVVDKIVAWVANEEWEKAETAYLDLYYYLKERFEVV
jgi:hypothetical protein